jgi:dethiobiotin synthetase
MAGDYWKPIQCGDVSDTATMEALLDTSKHRVFSPVYSLKAPLSPHHAARLEKIAIHVDEIIPPTTKRPLIIEMAGGIFVPLTMKDLSMDLFKAWVGKWVIVSRHYLGSINHTLLTLDTLKRQNFPIAGIIFNGEPNIDSESAILEFSNVPFLGRLLPEAKINSQTIQRYAQQWQSSRHLLAP